MFQLSSVMRRCGGRAAAATAASLLRRTTTTAAGSLVAGSSVVLSSPLLQSRRFAGDAALADVTRRELDEESHRSGKPEEPSPPAGWTVERAPRSSTFRLKRQFEDEQIMVRYTPTENTDVNYHEITVFITRQGGKTLQVDLSVEEGELVLDAISYHEDSALAVDETAEGDMKRAQLYPGPKISELDDAMVDSFIKYLEKRGINQEIGEFISLYSFWAEQQEYERWLQSLHDFVS